MFEYQPSRHPLQTFQFWFAILVCAGGVSIWRFHGSQNPGEPAHDQVESGAVFIEEIPPPPDGGLTLGDEFELSDLTSAPLQNEEQPEITEEPPLLIEQNPALQSFNTNDHSINDSPTTAAKPFPKSVSANQGQNTQNQGLTLRDKNIQQLSLEEPNSSELLQTAHLDLTQHQKAAPSVSQPSTSDQTLNLIEIDEMISAGEDVLALRKLSTVYWQSPQERPVIRSRLQQLSRRIYFQPHPHYMDSHEVQFGERLELIAKKYQVPWQYLEKLNRIDAQKLRAGKKLKVIQGPFNVVVDLTNFEATVHAHGYYVVRLPVGIGKDASTPVGKFKVTDKVEDPIYYGPDGVIKNDDPLNPLGEHWIAISDENNNLQGYGLHGTIDPDSIGKSESRGCVRFHDQDIEDLYHLLSIGSEVIIRR